MIAGQIGKVEIGKVEEEIDKVGQIDKVAELEDIEMVVGNLVDKRLEHLDKRCLVAACLVVPAPGSSWERC